MNYGTPSYYGTPSQPPPSHYGPAYSMYHGPPPYVPPPHETFAYNYDIQTEQISMNLLQAWSLEKLIPIFAQACLLSYEEFPRISVRFLQSLRVGDELGTQFLLRVSEMMNMFQVLSTFGLRPLLRPFLANAIYKIEQFPEIKPDDFEAWGISKEFTELFCFKISQPQFLSKLPQTSDSHSSKDPIPEEEIEKNKEVGELMRFLNMARKGVTMLKYPERTGMFAKKGDRMFIIQTLQRKQLGDAVLSWQKAGRDGKQSLKMLKILDINAVRPGLSKEFTNATYKNCFHIQTKDRILNLQASNQEQQSRWVRNLRLMLKYQSERVCYQRRRVRRRRRAPSESSLSSSDTTSERSESASSGETKI